MSILSWQAATSDYIDLTMKLPFNLVYVSMSNFWLNCENSEFDKHSEFLREFIEACGWTIEDFTIEQFNNKELN